LRVSRPAAAVKMAAVAHRTGSATWAAAGLIASYAPTLARCSTASRLQSRWRTSGCKAEVCASGAPRDPCPVRGPSHMFPPSLTRGPVSFAPDGLHGRRGNGRVEAGQFGPRTPASPRRASRARKIEGRVWECSERLGDKDALRRARDAPRRAPAGRASTCRPDHDLRDYGGHDKPSGSRFAGRTIGSGSYW
jgi:hypothetical protein